jgi:hypothetical protein
MMDPVADSFLFFQTVAMLANAFSGRDSWAPDKAVAVRLLADAAARMDPAVFNLHVRSSANLRRNTPHTTLPRAHGATRT